MSNKIETNHAAISFPHLAEDTLLDCSVEITIKVITEKGESIRTEVFPQKAVKGKTISELGTWITSLTYNSFVFIVSKRMLQERKK